MVMSPVSSGLAKTILQGTVKGGKKTRQTEEHVGRQHHRMDRPAVHQVPEGSGEQGKMEETRCKITCGAQMTLAVKGLMLLMMMMMNCYYVYKQMDSTQQSLSVSYVTAILNQAVFEPIRSHPTML